MTNMLTNPGAATFDTIARGASIFPVVDEEEAVSVEETTTVFALLDTTLNTPLNPVSDEVNPTVVMVEPTAGRVVTLENVICVPFALAVNAEAY